MTNSHSHQLWFDFPQVDYTEENARTWTALLLRYKELIPQCMCPQYQIQFDRISYRTDRIPLLKDVDTILRQSNGWRLVRVDGITPDEIFYQLLADRIFPSNDFIRDFKDIDYTPKPDLFHELVGHVPMLLDPIISSFSQKLGASLPFLSDRLGDQAKKILSRIYWFTIEFGLIQTDQGPRIFGAGFAPGEMKRVINHDIRLMPFKIEDVMNHSYNFWEMQQDLYVVESFEDMTQQFDRWLSTL